MRRASCSATRHAASGRPPAVLLLIIFIVTAGCASTGGVRTRQQTCAVFDSLYSYTGFEQPVTMSGRATIDADQKRVRGKMTLSVQPAGDVTFEFETSMFFGSQHEDFVLSVVNDTLRVLDRERGLFYEGEEAEYYIEESLAVAFGVREAMRLVTGRRPRCGDFEEVELRNESDGGVLFTGRVAQGPFRVLFSSGGGRLREITWPVSVADGRSDRLTVTYRWQQGGGRGLEEIVMRLDDREWRCILTDTNS